MPELWSDKLLGDVIELKRGYDLPASKRVEGDTPIISSSGPSGLHNQAKIAAPGVVTGRYGTIGQVFYVTKDFWPLNTTLYVRDFKGNDPRFVSYFLRGIDFLAYSDKAAVPGVNRNHLHEAEVRVPDVDTQKQIVRVLASLDDKIELNRRMNETLEEMARALFRDWFVDFGPTRRQMEGATDPAAIMGHAFPPEKAAELAPLFPARLGDDGLPEGWEPRSIYDFAKVIYGAPFKSKQFNTEGRGRPLARIRDLPKNAAGQFTEEVHRKEHLIQPGDIVVGMDGEFRSYLWFGVPTLMNQRICSFVPIERSNRAFVWLAIKPLLKFFEDTAIATTVIHLGKGDIDTFSVVDPGQELMAAFSAAIEPMASKIVANGQENQTLAEMRDLLLPKLMSGDIRLKDAEAAV